MANSFSSFAATGMRGKCSRCGLCNTYYIAHVNNACASGMSRVEDLEPIVHEGRWVDEMYLRIRPICQENGTCSRKVPRIICADGYPAIQDHDTPIIMWSRKAPRIICADGYPARFMY